MEHLGYIFPFYKASTKTTRGFPIATWKITRPYDIPTEPGTFLENIRTWINLAGWWFGTFSIFPYIGFLIIPIDVHIFQRGGPTTNQLGLPTKAAPCVCFFEESRRDQWASSPTLISQHFSPLSLMRFALREVIFSTCGAFLNWGDPHSWLLYKGKVHLEMDDGMGVPPFSEFSTCVFCGWFHREKSPRWEFFTGLISQLGGDPGEEQSHGFPLWNGAPVPSPSWPWVYHGGWGRNFMKLDETWNLGTMGQAWGTMVGCFV